MAVIAQPVSPVSFATFGDLLKFLRRRERLTQLDLSIAVGYSEAQISRLEKNQRLPDLTAVKALFIPALHLEQDHDLAARLLELAQSARAEDAPAPGFAPYKGLLFFDETDAEWFFGREALTTQLVARVRTMAQSPPSRLFAVVGASGSGKSSIVRAGLAVALEKADWEVRVFTPTAQPLKMLETQFAPAFTDHAHRIAIVDQFEEVFTLCRDEMVRAAFVEKLVAAANEPHGSWSIVIALRADFYSHCAQYPPLRQAIAAQQEYIGQMTAEELRCAIEEPARHGGWEFQPGLVELMLRDVGANGTQDQEPGALPLLSHALLATWERRRGRTMTLEGYRASGAVRGAIAETAESVFTDQLNPTQQQFARDIFLRLTELGEGTEDTRRRAALTELVPRAEQAAALRAVLNTLAGARLVSLGEDSAEVAHEALIREWQRLRGWLNEDRESLRLHRQLTEAAREWALLQQDAGALYRGARLAQAREFAQANPGALNDQERAFLQASEEQETRESREKEELRQRELEAARKLAETEQRANIQLRRRAVFLAGAFILAVVLAGVALFFGNKANESALAAAQNAKEAGQARDESQVQQRIANSRALAAYALNNLTLDPQRSILLALQAIKATEPNQTVLPEAEDALHRAIIASHAEAQLPFYASGQTAPPVDAYRTFRASFSPDGSRIAMRGPGVLKILDAGTHRELLNLPVGPDFGAIGLAYNADGTQIATLDRDTSESETLVKIFDANSGRLLRQTRLAQSWGDVFGAGFGPDLNGVVLMPFSDSPIHVWDTTSGQAAVTLAVKNDGSMFPGVTYSPDGKRLAIAINDTAVKILDAATGNELMTLCCHTATVVRAAFSPDGTQIATVGWDYKVKIWNAQTGKELNSLTGHSNVLTGVVWSPDGKRLASTSWDRKAIIWDAAAGKLIYELPGHTDLVQDANFSPDGKTLITASDDKTAMLWDVGPSRELSAFQEPFSVFPAGYNADRSHFSTVDGQGELKIWNTQTLQPLLTLATNRQITGLGELVVSPDEKLFVFPSEDSTIHVLDLPGGNERYAIPPVKDGFTWGAAFSPDGTHMAATLNVDDGIHLRVWETLTGKMLPTLSPGKAPGTFVEIVTWSPDSKRLVTGNANGLIQAWDANTGAHLFDLPGHTNWIWQILYSPDGSMIATASRDGLAIVHDSETGKELYRLVGHTSTVDSLDWSPDGKRIVTASSDGTAKLWDATNGTELATFNQGSYPVEGAIFTADGKHVITTSDDGAIRVYTLDVNELIQIAKARLIRTWRPDECDKYLHVEKCPTE